MRNPVVVALRSTRSMKDEIETGIIRMSKGTGESAGDHTYIYENAYTESKSMCLGVHVGEGWFDTNQVSGYVRGRWFARSHWPIHQVRRHSLASQSTE